MIIEIEYYKGNAVLFGKRIDRAVLRRMLNEAGRVCGDTGDLAEMLCRRYGFERIADNIRPDLIYDRDTGRLYAPKG